MSYHRSQHNVNRAVIALVLVILFGIVGAIGAQDVPATDTPVATDIPTEVPPTSEPATEAPTVEPTLAPTQEPTVAPTLEPTTEVLTDTPVSAPTDVPTEVPTEVVTEEIPATATLEVTPSPTVVSDPPVFNLVAGMTFDASAETPLVFDGTVSDSLGVVRIVASGSLGTVTMTAVEPTETSAPFVTAFQISYVAQADFVGADMLTLTAINSAGVQAVVTLTINVAPVLPTVTPTLEPTPVAEPMNELLIQYDPAASEETIQAKLAKLGAVEIGRLPQIGVMRALVPESASQPAVAMATVQSSSEARLAGVTSAEENVTYHLAYTPTDPLFPQQWGSSNSTGGIYAPYAWDLSTTRGLGIKVAVIDSGVDLQHPDFYYQLVPGWDFYNDDNNPDDDFGHGTHVAGIIAARANNGKGIAGVAFNAKVMPLKACDNTGACPAYFIAGAIIYAADMGAQVINLSLASDESSSTLQGAINYALSRNVTVVAAAGNTGDTTVEYPAAYPGVIAVGAHDNTGAIWSGSTHNINVDISAPGVAIKSLYPVELDTTDGTADGYTDKTGTSMSTAFTSGTAALLMSAKVATTPATVFDALVCGAEDDLVNPGRDDYFGYGRLKADLSMNWNYNTASCKVTLPNDNFESAKIVPSAVFSFTQPISDRSVTEQSSDPAQICGIAREQTLWYSYKPAANGYYQFSTLGSSYSNVIGVYRGSQGALTSVGCATNGQVPVALDAAQTYYLVVSTNGAPVNNQILQVRVNPVMFTNNVDYQENATAIAYVGMWSRVVVTGASYYYTQQTTDTGAMAAFSFRGNRFDYVRTIGPDRGQVKVYINGDTLNPIVVSNQGAIQKANQAISINVPGGVFGGWNTVYIVRDSSVPGIVDIDRIRTYDFDNNTLAAVITGKVDDGAANLRYITVNSSSDWIKTPYTGAYLGKVSQTSVENAGVAFRFSGNALTLFRMTGSSGFADMQVTIDNTLTLTVSNTAGTTAIRPYTINGLTTMTHVVEIRKLGATGMIQLDAVQAATLPNLAAGTKYDDRNPYLAYRGVWQDAASVPGAYLGTTRSLSSGSEVSFRFLGNDLCIGYRTPISALQVYIDGALIKTIPADASTGIVTNWCMEADLHTLLADTVHYARLVSMADSFALDYVQALRYTTLTPALKVVQESHLSFRYGTPADWVLKTTAAISMGSFRPQGGALKSTFADNTTITFYINGTGFILYTAVGNDRGCWEMKVDDASLDPIDLGGNNVLGTQANPRYRPLGYGISGLLPGIHRVELKADVNCSSFVPGGLPATFPVDFDAVRVFP